jgi:hypothetical protein
MTVSTIDEYMKLGKTTVLKCLQYYCSSINECFLEEFLCRPTVVNTQRLLVKPEESGFPGMLGMLLLVIDSNNNINVLNQFPLFIDVIRGHTPEVSFTVNDREHHMRYYLTDDIYHS